MFYKEFKKYAFQIARDDDDMEVVEGLTLRYKKHGMLDFNSMINDGLVKIGLENGIPIPLSVYKTDMDTLLIGQINSVKELHGLGKKITPWSVIEGEFKHNRLTGIGRHLRNDRIYAIGHWKSHDKLCGYGIRIADGVRIEGQWDDECFFKGVPAEKKEDIKNYNPNVHICSMKIDYSKYEIEPLDFDAM